MSNEWKVENDSPPTFSIEEIEDEQRWDELFAKSQGRWSKLVAKVLADDDAGLTEEFELAACSDCNC